MSFLKKYLRCTSHQFFPSNKTSLLVPPYLYTCSVNPNTDADFISLLLRVSLIDSTADGNSMF